jgi:uridine kinase
MPSSSIPYPALTRALQHLRPAERSLLVCIDGCGASGKSTVAAGLAAACDEVQVVHVDDFYRPSADRYAGALVERPVAGDFDLERLRAEVLLPLRSGLPANHHVYDWATDRVGAHAVRVSQAIVVVEGVYSSSAALAGLFDFSIWVECPRELRLARGLARDGEAARSRWVQDWMRGEDQYLEREQPHERAALVCDGSRDSTSGVVVLRGSERLIAG